MAERNAMTSTLSDSAIGTAFGFWAITEGELYGDMVVSKEAIVEDWMGEYGGAGGSPAAGVDIEGTF